MGLKSDFFSLAASAARTASGTGTLTADLSAYEDGALLINVTAATGTTPTLRPFLQVSPDGGTTWYGSATASPCAAGADITTTGTYYYDFTGHAGALTRLAWTIGGTTPSFTFTGAIVVRR